MGTTQSRADAERWPRVYFWHLPKTGGTSFGHWLRGQYPRALVLPANSRVELIDPTPGPFDAYRCFVGHFGTAIPRLLAEPIPAVTLLRDPIERCLSHLRWVQREPPMVRQNPRRYAQYEAVRRHGDDLEACLDEPLVRELLGNSQARWLTEPIDLAPYLGGPLEKLFEYFDALDARPSPGEAELAAQARAQLDAMLVVGTCERFEESADLMAHALGLQPPRRWPRDNAAPERRAEAGFRWQQRVSDRVLEQLAALTAVDRELHAEAEARLARQLAERARAAAARAEERRRALVVDSRWAGVPVRERFARAAAACRFGEWWEHELPPLLLLAYQVFALHARAVSSRPGFFAGLLAALAGLGVFARVSSGQAELAAEAAQGRPNPLRFVPAGGRLALAGGALGVAVAGLWGAGAGPAAALLFASSAALHGLRAFSPAWLRGRGAAGAIHAVAALRTLPALLVLQLAGRAAGGVPTAVAVAAVAWWSAWGLRLELWRRLGDPVTALRAGVGLGALAPRTLRRIGERVLLPVELAGLAAFVALAGARLPALALGAFALAELARVRGGARLVLVKPRSRRELWPWNLYEVLLPLTALAAQALRFGGDGLALAAHVLLFPRGLLRLCRAAALRLRRSVSRLDP